MPEKRSQKFALDFGSDDDDDDKDSVAGVELKINEEYAKRFEHNKKREEKQRLEEKYKKNKRKRSSDSDSGSDSQNEGLDDSDSDDDSSSEEEDEFGQFADEVPDEDILTAIEVIRAKDPCLYDGKTNFFEHLGEGDDEDGEEGQKKQKEKKPMFLKDYHRINLLNRRNPAEDEENNEQPKTYLEEQEALKRDLVRDMHNAANGLIQDGDDDENEDDFLTAKSAPIRENIPSPPDPETADPENPDEYLKSFLASKAWLPKDRKNVYGPAMESDDSEEEEIAEQFEQGFNLRFEDPEKAEQLVGHARGAVKAMTARREAMSSRKRAREAKKLKKEEEQKEREIEKGRLRALKVEELMEKVKKIQEVAGLGDGDEDSLRVLLKGGFSEAQWDEYMAKKFNDDYYEVKEKELPEKPVWEDDIDIGDIEMDDGDEAGGNGDGDAEEDEPKSKRKTRKDYEKEKREKKKRDRDTRKEIENFVDENIDLDLEVSAGKSSSGRFRYREVTPETFGLTPLDILAADDANLNEYAGLKRYATFRPKDRKKQDKKKYSKKRNLREWRKAVFGDENGPVVPALDAKQTESAEKKVGEKLKAEGTGDGEEKKKKRRKRR